MRPVVILALLLASCAADPHALTFVDQNAPLWNPNPSMWDAASNKLTDAPTLPVGIQAQKR